jgi:SRSO17 transposase
LAHGFRIIKRGEKSVLVERQYYGEDGRLETKQYWKEL